MFNSVARDVAGNALFDCAIKASEALAVKDPRIAALDQRVVKSFLAHQVSTTTAGAVDAGHAASLVFAHAVLDAAVSDLLRVDAAARRLFWEQTVGQQEVRLTISELQKFSYDSVLSKAIDTHLKKLERLSLGKRMRVLHDGCRSTLAVFEEPGGYSFSTERIRSFDQTRHSIVHGDALALGVGDSSEEVNYAWRTNFYLNILVQSAGKLTFEAEHWLNRSVRH